MILIFYNLNSARYGITFYLNALYPPKMYHEGFEIRNIIKKICILHKTIKKTLLKN